MQRIRVFSNVTNSSIFIGKGAFGMIDVSNDLKKVQCWSDSGWNNTDGWIDSGWNNTDGWVDSGWNNW